MAPVDMRLAVRRVPPWCSEGRATRGLLAQPRGDRGKAEPGVRVVRSELVDRVDPGRWSLHHTENSKDAGGKGSIQRSSTLLCAGERSCTDTNAVAGPPSRQGE